MSKTMNETMKELGIKVCPICGKEYSEPPAISRKDNKTEICSHCGTLEGLMAYMNDKFEGDKEKDEIYCIFEKKLCRFARNKNGAFKCIAPSDTTLKFICK